MKGVLSWLARRLSCRYKRFLRFLFCLGCSSPPRTKYFFLTGHYLTSFVPIPQQAVSLGGTLFFLLKLWAALRHVRRFFYCNNFVTITENFATAFYVVFTCILHSSFSIFLFTFLGASGLMMRFWWTLQTEIIPGKPRSRTFFNFPQNLLFIFRVFTFHIRIFTWMKFLE